MKWESNVNSSVNKMALNATSKGENNLLLQTDQNTYKNKIYTRRYLVKTSVTPQQTQVQQEDCFRTGGL